MLDDDIFVGGQKWAHLPCMHFSSVGVGHRLEKEANWKMNNICTPPLPSYYNTNTAAVCCVHVTADGGPEPHIVCAQRWKWWMYKHNYAVTIWK